VGHFAKFSGDSTTSNKNTNNPGQNSVVLNLLSK